MKHSEEDKEYADSIDLNEELALEELELDAYEMTIGSISLGSTQYKFIHMNDIEGKVNQKIEQVKDLFSIDEDMAFILMKSYAWNLDKLQQEYFEDDIKVKKQLGLIPNITTKLGTISTCNICLNKLAEGDNLSCGHSFCVKCWKGYCEALLEPGNDPTQGRCPHTGCSLRIPMSFFRKCIPKALFSKYKKVFYKSFTDGNKTLRWCPFPNCDYLVENVSLVPIEVNCKCGNSFCFSCGLPNHLPATCEMLKKWIIKTSTDGESMTWILAHTKQCPKCTKPIEKNQGCNHIKCCRCGHEFCWVCLDSWKVHNYQTGGYYKCNRFNEPDIKETQKREKAKTNLAKYTFYFQRYDNHEKAEKLAIKQATSTDEYIKKLNQRCSYPISELEFLQSAADSIIQIRRTLKHSYVYGYYLDNVKEKELYEHLQGRLEVNAEHLHQLLERDLSEFYNLDVAEKKRKENFMKYKEELMNYYTVTKKVFLLTPSSSLINSVKG